MCQQVQAAASLHTSQGCSVLCVWAWCGAVILICYVLVVMLVHANPGTRLPQACRWDVLLTMAQTWRARVE